MARFAGRRIMRGGKILAGMSFFVKILVLVGIAQICRGYPSALDGYRFVDRELPSPGAHQLASWLASQLRKGDISPMQDMPIIPYRLPLQGKRNSEVTNAIIGSEETQKMYRDGKK